MRVDGRAAGEVRPVKITPGFISSAEGSVLYEQGLTRVICTATVEDRVPHFLKDKGTGWITAEYGMLPRSTDTRMMRESVTGRLGGRTHEIQRLIGRALRSVVDLGLLGERTITVDCDVIQADGGTRTASVTAGFLAMRAALEHARGIGLISKVPILDSLAAISVGIVDGRVLTDLCYREDSVAEVDMNVVMNGRGEFIEVQGTAEGHPFSRARLDELLSAAHDGIMELLSRQLQSGT